MLAAGLAKVGIVGALAFGAEVGIHLWIQTGTGLCGIGLLRLAQGSLRGNQRRAGLQTLLDQRIQSG